MNVMALFLALLSYPLGAINFDPKSVQSVQQAKRATLLVHGFLHNRSAWLYLQRRLKSCGRVGPVFTVNLGHPFHSIEEYTAILQKRVEQIKGLMNLMDLMDGSSSPLELNLVGHSMGGLVSLNYAAECDGNKGVSIAKVVTIASPLQGSKLAILAKVWSAAGAEMVPGSPFLKALHEKLKLKQREHKFPIYRIGCSKDLVVSASRTYFPGEANDCVFPRMGHFAPLYSPQVAEQIISWLQEQ
jgi:pimeloyl-ACP methyl ester carboxylesterase